MFSRFSSLKCIRRCLHTQIPQHTTRSRVSSSRLRVTVGASVAVASYITWRLTHGQRIALDSATTLDSPKNTVALDGPSSETAKSVPTKKRTRSRSEAPRNSEQEEAASTVVEGEKSEGKSEGEGSTEAGGAFNPVTGEINWDCPCLGGMAYGPCGQEFREAFSCFVFSEEEPKGINCVEMFKAMQTCFRQHPEHYADEIMDDEDEEPPNSSPDTSDTKTENPNSPTDSSTAQSQS
ncbi:hypothetical protein E1B28_000595 [Marasmius oreades]|uniref:Mitochondrial intermembrane space import and assembly protein 40 n=1 Tax=Marasmius oreades TaxID=181124 RepID=A0A9P8AEB0_9AGAR|nr:uncharacterized protein E1B28_000595 [Marasmius oreades]KAG7098681.1 hypothetical protein E1B28_000595 [Marasmius oreades]